MERARRPMGVTIVAFLAFFVAVATALLAVAAFLVPGASEPLVTVLPIALAPRVAGTVLLLIAAVLAVTGAALLARKPWSWYAAVALVVLSAAGDVQRLARRDLGGLAGIAVVGVMVCYLLRPEVRAWFRD